ncbi:MAG: undecaprenyl-diphosphatase UppP [Bryobacteraceae bacterium]
MPLYQAVLLAIVQGFTEFLPISSSAHLALAPWLLGWEDQGLTFDIALHFGTLAAVVMYFFRDWVQIVGQGFGLQWGSDPELSKNPKLLWLLAAASLPIGFFGYVFQKQAETTWRNPIVIGVMLIAIGVLMWVAENVGKRTRDIGAVNLTDSLAIGVGQALAIVPGTSRSGITITTGLFRNLDRYAAARFSFLLSTPAIAAAAASAAHHLYKQGGIPPGMMMPFLVGILVSAITGSIVIAFFLKFLKEHSLKFFVYYRIVFGIIVIALAVFRR